MKVFDTFDRPEGWASPSVAFADDFAAGHRVQIAPWGGYAILGHRELLQLSRDPAVDGAAPDRQAMARTPKLYELISRALFTKAGSVHRVERASLIAAFNAVPLSEVIERAAESVLETLPAKFNLRDELVNPVVRQVWTGVIGLSPSDAVELEAAVRDLGYMLSSSPQPDKAAISEEAVGHIRRLSIRAMRSGSPFSRALNSLSNEQAVDLIAGMAFDGLESSATGLDSALRVAFSHRRYIEANGQCANECLRLASPTPMTTRQTTDRIALGDLIIEPGTMLSMIWAAGNHDPWVFRDPERFVPDRGSARPLTFGMGQHACLGHAVVRATLIRLLAELQRMRPSGTVMSIWRPLSKDWLHPLAVQCQSVR